MASQVAANARSTEPLKSHFSLPLASEKVELDSSGDRLISPSDLLKHLTASIKKPFSRLRRHFTFAVNAQNGFTSSATALWPRIAAVKGVVPEPANGSSTVSLRLPRDAAFRA